MFLVCFILVTAKVIKQIEMHRTNVGVRVCIDKHTKALPNRMRVAKMCRFERFSRKIPK